MNYLPVLNLFLNVSFCWHNLYSTYFWGRLMSRAFLSLSIYGFSSSCYITYLFVRDGFPIDWDYCRFININNNISCTFREKKPIVWVRFSWSDTIQCGLLLHYKTKFTFFSCSYEGVTCIIRYKTAHYILSLSVCSLFLLNKGKK